jgi:hypothetical protein
MSIIERNGFKIAVSANGHYNNFSAVLDSYYDGAPDTKPGLATMIGYGATEELAIEDLMDQVDEYQAEQELDYDDGLSDVEADAMTLASAGMGTDEDYGYYGDDEEW